MKTSSLKREFHFRTYVPKIPEIRPDGFQRFIAIATKGDRPVAESDSVRAAEGWVGYDVSDQGHIASLIKISQLAAKKKPGKYQFQSLEIGYTELNASTPKPLAEIISDPQLVRNLGISQIGHDYRRASPNNFEIPRDIGGTLALQFEEDGFTEIKETPGIDDVVRSAYKPGEPVPHKHLIKRVQERGGLISFTLLGL